MCSENGKVSIDFENIILSIVDLMLKNIIGSFQSIIGSSILTLYLEMQYANGPMHVYFFESCFNILYMQKYSIYVTGSAKTRHNGVSLNFQYRLLIAMGKIFA